MLSAPLGPARGVGLLSSAQPWKLCLRGVGDKDRGEGLLTSLWARRLKPHPPRALPVSRENGCSSRTP